MRNRSILYFAGFMVAILGFLVFDYTLRAQYIIKKSQTRDNAAVSQTAEPALASVGADIQSRARFLGRFKNFVSQMSAIADEPEQSEELLTQFSQTIQSSDILALSDVLGDIKNRNDERTLALDLMIAHQDFNAHNLLNTFAQNESFGARANSDFEIALRAQAIEGLTLFADKKLVRKNLENLKVRTKHAFLYDRADRAINYLSDQNLATQLDSADAKASTR